MRLNVALEGMQVLAVASAMRQEGKTSLSAQLSVSFARTLHGRVLLIDADMRSPDQHRVFNVENTGGLAQVLEGKLDSESAIVPTLDHNLDLLPAGKLRRSPHELASNGAFRGLIESLRERYETIIIDTPPVLAAAEALAFASVADATVLCTMQNKSCRDQIIRAYERLQVVGANPLGIVLNGVSVSRYAYAYGGEYS
jgi:capsular exopolysaccharide synthesis family protein